MAPTALAHKKITIRKTKVIMINKSPLVTSVHTEGSQELITLPVCLGILMRMAHYFKGRSFFCSQAGSTLPLALSFKPSEIRTFNFLPLTAFENWPLHSMGFSRKVSSDSAEPRTWGLLGQG